MENGKWGSLTLIGSHISCCNNVPVMQHKFVFEVGTADAVVNSDINFGTLNCGHMGKLLFLHLWGFPDNTNVLAFLST